MNQRSSIDELDPSDPFRNSGSPTDDQLTMDRQQAQESVFINVLARVQRQSDPQATQPLPLPLGLYLNLAI